MKTNRLTIISKHYGTEGLTFARKCDECMKGMNEGYCISSGTEYYCSKKCLHKHYTAKEWDRLYKADQDSYYTKWEDTFDHQYKIVKGKLVEIDVQPTAA